jgi:hypothetical protein
MLLNFSRGRTGLGLLILRCTVAVVVLVIGGLHLTTGRQTEPSVVVVLMGLAILIGLGLFTSVSSALAGILIVILMFASQAELTINSALAMLCLAITLMGGGAYSIDGLLHGGRKITLPKS